jgi:hypothetical protein
LGYFSKIRVSTTQLAPETDEQSVRNVDDLKNKAGAPEKLPESRKGESQVIEELKVHDLKVKTIELDPILLSTH